MVRITTKNKESKLRAFISGTAKSTQRAITARRTNADSEKSDAIDCYTCFWFIISANYCEKQSIGSSNSLIPVLLAGFSQQQFSAVVPSLSAVKLSDQSPMTFYHYKKKLSALDVFLSTLL